MFKVYKDSCKNCLLSKDSIVSPARRASIIKECTNKQIHFNCHKSTIQNKEICCHKFYKELGHVSQIIRIAERLNAIEFVDQIDKTKLIPYKK